MALSEDEAKIVVGILSKLNYSLKDARIVLSIINKLEEDIKSPSIKPKDVPNVKEQAVEVDKALPTN